jgi:uncharacterized protein
LKALLASPLGFVVGLTMGALGAGGSLIAIPALVYLVGQEPRAAQATALVIVLGGSLSGLIAYLRRDQARWRAGTVFGIAAGVSALAGSQLNRQLDPDLLLLLFAPVMLAGAAAMISSRAREPGRFRPWRLGVSRHQVVGVAVLGGLVGWLIGLFGIGGGFVVVPVLVLALRFSPLEAVATSLLIITIAALFALGDRLVSGDVEWSVAIPFGVAALAGGVAGQRVAERVDGPRLRQAFAGLIAAAAVYTAARSLAAL